MSSCCKKDLFVTLNCTTPATGRSRIVSVRNCWFQLQMRSVKTSGYRVSIGFADFLNLGVLRFRNYCFFLSLKSTVNNFLRFERVGTFFVPFFFKFYNFCLINNKHFQRNVKYIIFHLVSIYFFFLYCV